MTQQLEDSDSVNDDSADSGVCLCCFPSVSQLDLSCIIYLYTHTLAQKMEGRLLYVCLKMDNI